MNPAPHSVLATLVLRLTWYGDSGGRQTFHATNTTPLQGFCRASIRTTTTRSSIGGVPEAPEFQRQGIADALTAAHLHWIWKRSTNAWYVVNAQNLVSVDLHLK